MQQKFKIGIRSTNATILAFNYLVDKYGYILHDNESFNLQSCYEDLFRQYPKDNSDCRLSIYFNIIRKETSNSYKVLGKNHLCSRDGYDRFIKAFYHNSSRDVFYIKPEKKVPDSLIFN